MKKIVVILSVAFILCSCGKPSYKYRINTGSGETYFTNAYKKIGECITFETSCNCGEKSDAKKDITTVCGSYGVTEYSGYEPTGN